MTKEEFGAMIDSYEKLVYTICYQMVRDHGEAENLAQETFLSAYTHRDAAPPGKLKPWLARIATNKAKDYLKSAWARRVETSDTLPDGAGSGPQPEALFLKKEELTRLQDHIYALREPYKKVTVMALLEEKSIDEIAEALHRPKKTVQTQLGRARQLLRETLRKEADT